MRRLCGLLTVGLFLVFVAGLAPHLVHHLFEDKPHATTSDCPFASLAERQPGAQLLESASWVDASAGVPVAVPDDGMAPVLARPASEARAPPIAAS
jgi:hypothetical protein